VDRTIARWRLHTQGLSTPRATSAKEVVRTLLCVQAENPAQSAWAVATRTTAPDAADLAARLASGEVLRTHVLRPTWHYVLREDSDWLLALTGPRIRPLVERQLDRDIGLGAADLDVLRDTVQAVLSESPDLTRAQLVDALRERTPVGARLSGQGPMMLMAYLELERVVCSGRPAAGEHTYALWSQRVGDRAPLPDHDEALGRLALRYVTGHGPATAKDLAYWATLALGQARRGIEVVRDRLESFEHDGRVFWHVPGAGDPAAPAEPAGHLLQLLDEMYRGYQDSRAVIDAEGVAPGGRETAIGMALVDGQVVAGMRRAVDRTRVRFHVVPHRPLAAHERAAVDAAAQRYAAFLGLEPEVSVRAD
jgi:hypothetical protein